MNDVSLVGAHIGGSVDALKVVPFHHLKWGMEWFQVFASPPRNSNPPILKPEMVDLIKKFPNIKLIFHSPYWVSLSSNKNRGYNLHYIKELMNECLKVGIPFKYVTHLGYPEPRELDYGECQDNVQFFLYRVLDMWSSDLEGVLWLESDSGHRQLWNGYNGVHSLLEIVERIDNKKIRICCDVEHVYASGEDAPREDDQWKWITCVHLNSIPAEVIRGRGLDRHSTTALEDCKIGSKIVKFYYNRVLQCRIPCILERRDLSIVEKDIQYLKNLDLSEE